jgi:hypothetical protein
MMARAEDYSWFSARCGELAQSYCLTWVRGATPNEVIRRLGGVNPFHLQGLDDLDASAGRTTYLENAVEGGTFHTDRTTGFEFVAVVQLDGWSLVVEPNGYLCTEDAARVRLSQHTTIISVYYNENTYSRFALIRDGETELECNPADPSWRTGRQSEDHLGIMATLGFPISTGLDTDDSDFETDNSELPYDEMHRERMLALAEHFTRIRLEYIDLEKADFACASVPIPER